VCAKQFFYKGEGELKHLILASVLSVLFLSGCSKTAATPVETADVEEKQGQPQADDPLQPNAPAPSPELMPDQVVKIQLEALQSNDSTDRGIEIVFRFASPANKQNTGPLDRFSRMIKVPPYSPMLNHRRVDYDAIQIVGDEARQRVTLVDRRGNVIVYVFYLSKQTEEPCKDCWMTDAVTIESMQPREEETAGHWYGSHEVSVKK
jgi:hypothetical protein